MDHCFDHWNATSAFPFFDEQAQREAFREMMTKAAGYYDEVYSFDGKLELKAKSWSYAKMSTRGIRISLSCTYSSCYD
jgi:hypothetical protein